MTTIAAFPTPEEAHMFRAYLGAQGVDAFLIDENVVQLFWHYSNAVGGVRVVVDESDAGVAAEAYETYMRDLRIGPYPLNPVRAWPLVILVSLLVGAPFLLFGRRSTRTPE
jgi:hypothetical protein